MKLLWCGFCRTMFSLPYLAFKECKCGAVVGGYIDESRAVVNGLGRSIAIGNGSLGTAIGSADAVNSAISDQDISREGFIKIGAISHAWVRPHEGKGNPHTTVYKHLLPDMDADVIKKKLHDLVPNRDLGMK